MKRDKSFAAGRFVGRYIVGPLIVAIIVVGLAFALGTLIRMLGVVLGWW